MPPLMDRPVSSAPNLVTRHGARLIEIPAEDFTFGGSLNLGADAAALGVLSHFTGIARGVIAIGGSALFVTLLFTVGQRLLGGEGGARGHVGRTTTYRSEGPAPEWHLSRAATRRVRCCAHDRCRSAQPHRPAGSL